MFRTLRIAVLLFILATVAVGAWRSHAQATDWKDSIHVTIYPIAADASAASRQIVAQLRPDDFAAVGEWLQEEVLRHGNPVLRPVALNLAPPVEALPPPYPQGGNSLSVAWWSLQLRLWAWRHDGAPGPRPQIRLFVLYHDPALSPVLEHSVGLEKGKIGIIKVFASRSEHQRNLVIVAHELLHTLGASDKYDRATNQPIFPDGYAEPEHQPRHPQHLAEIMAGRVPVSENQALIPDSLADTRIGPATAREIGLGAPR
ncbi:hypothetical protein [Zoogloea sp.]|uniref:hypothetical protein n=1 Tax=Zoogloea sp. TaxID=49181 RepID=UPI0014162A6D|nr:MAG: hypothetical protein F9K15_06770 [Zoogloea sp.]